MAEYLIQDETLKLLATGIRQKGGITAELTPKDMIKNLFALETETDTGLTSGVNFYDYDGTLLHSYTLKEAQELTALPEAPTHDGITFAGWTHTLEKVNDTLTTLDVGATYNSESTQMTINLTEPTTFSFYFEQSISDDTSIDWGDGSTAETLSETGAVCASHSYAAAGEYVIKLTSAEGEIEFGIANDKYATLTYNGDGVNGNTFGAFIGSGEPNANALLVTRIVLGNNVRMGNGHYTVSSTKVVYSSEFYHCENLESLIISVGVNQIGTETFRECHKLKCVIIHKNVDFARYSFRACIGMTKVIFASGFWFNGSYGEGAFYGCSALESIDLPPAVTETVGSAFYGCTALKRIHCRSKTPPSFGSRTFKNVPSSCVMYVPLFSVDAYTDTITNGYSQYEGKIKGEPTL